MRTTEQYLTDLKSMRRNVFIGGELVHRDDARLIGSVRVLQTTFELA